MVLLALGLVAVVVIVVVVVAVVVIVSFMITVVQMVESCAGKGPTLHHHIGNAFQQLLQELCATALVCVPGANNTMCCCGRCC